MLEKLAQRDLLDFRERGENREPPVKSANEDPLERPAPLAPLVYKVKRDQQENVVYPV